MTDTVNEKASAPPIWFLALCTGIAVVGLTILAPTLPLMKTELNVSSAAVQQVLTVYMVALALGQLIYGPISDRVGRRPVLLAGTVLFTIAGLASMFVQSIGSLIVLRVLQGLGAAACIAMGRAIVNDVFDREDGARTLSSISIVLAIAPALSLFFGGVLAEYAGWKGAMAVLTISGIILFLTGVRIVSETNMHKLTQINIGSVLSAYKTVLRDKVFIAWAMAGGMQVGIFFALAGFLGYQYQRHGYTMAEFGMWFALTPISYILGNTANRHWFIKKGIERAALIGCVFSGVAVLLLSLTQAIGMTHALSLALPCCLFGFSNGIVIGNATIGAISAVGKHAGTGSGIVGAWQMATSGIAGAIIVAIGGAQVFSIAAATLMVMSLIAIVSMLFVYKRRVPVNASAIKAA